jgi:transcriptional regulator GlxA family with amidase domain
MLIDDGTIITAGGLMAWTDLGLHLIGMMFGEDVLQEVARFFLIDPGGREQGHYRSFVHPAANDDPAIRRVQEALVSKRAWMPVHEMARVAGLEERTFLRRFRAAIGMSPRDYGRAFHFEQARNMLRSTQRPVGQVAWAVGYADAATFTREFTREMGLPPGEYRRRFHPALGRN